MCTSLSWKLCLLAVIVALPAVMACTSEYAQTSTIDALVPAIECISDFAKTIFGIEVTEVETQTNVEGRAPAMSHANNTVSPDFEVVVAHYKEDLSWLEPLASDTIVYTKGVPYLRHKLRPGLDNIGRESHSYLYHLFTNYKILADVTIFVQGDVYNSEGSVPPRSTMGMREMKRRALDLKAGEVLPLGDRRRRFVDWNGMPWEKCQAQAEWYENHGGDEMSRAERTPGELWAKVTKTEHPQAVYWTEGACFAVRADDVRKRPREFYKKLLLMFSEDSQEEGHYMERFWFAIFSDRYIEQDPSKRREEDKEVVTCKVEECEAHGASSVLDLTVAVGTQDDSSIQDE